MITKEEQIKKCLENIYENGLDKGIYKSLWEEEAIKKAKEIDERIKKGEKLGPLAGMPLAITEDISTKGGLTEAGSKILSGYKPPFNATIVEKLMEADGIILGKIRTSEFNLKDRDFSSKCIQDGGCLAAIGSNHQGKNVVKLNASYGLISRYGIISPSSSLSPLTIMAKNIEDVDLVFKTIKGYDKMDSTSIDLEKHPTSTDKATSKEVQIKIPENLAEITEELKLDAEKVSVEYEDYILPAYKIISSAEFASITSRYDGIRYGYRTKNYEDREELYKNTRTEGFGREAKKTIIFGNHIINAGQYELYYKKAQQVRSLIKKEVDEILAGNSVLVLPLADSLDENLKAAYKKLGSMTGYPMISIPYQGDGNDYVEIYILAPQFQEDLLIQLASKLVNELGVKGGGK